MRISLGKLKKSMLEVVSGCPGLGCVPGVSLGIVRQERISAAVCGVSLAGLGNKV